MARMVESRCGAVALGRTYLLPPLSSGGASMVPPWLRFHIPLIEPDRQISRLGLSAKTSRFRVQRHLRRRNIYCHCQLSQSPRPPPPIPPSLNSRPFPPPPFP